MCLIFMAVVALKEAAGSAGLHRENESKKKYQSSFMTQWVNHA